MKKIHRQLRYSENTPPRVGPDDRGRAPHAGDVALHPGPLLHGVQVADDGDRHRQHRTGADALDRPGDDQGRHAPRDAAQDRAGHEHRDAEEQHRSPPDDVGQLAVQRHRHGLRQQVDGEQPGELREATQVADDRGHGRRDDRRVERDQRRRQHQRDEDRARARTGGRRRTACLWWSSLVPTHRTQDPFPMRQDGQDMTLADRVPAAPDPDSLFDSFAEWAGEEGLDLYPAQTEALIELVSGNNVVLATPTGSGKSLVATGALYAALAQGRRGVWTAPDQGTRVGEVLRAVRDLRCAERRHAHRRRGGEPRGADHHRDRRGHRQPGAARGPGRRPRARRDGRVPLLRRPGPRLGLAGAAARADPGAVPADVGHPGRRHPVPGRPHPAYRPVDRRRRHRRPPGAAALLLRPYAGARDARGAAEHRPGAGVRRAPDAGRCPRTRAGAHQRQRRDPRAARRDRRGRRRLPVLRRVRQDAVPAGPARHRRAPRRDAAALPPAGRDPRAGRAAQGRVRHRHPRRRHQRADPHGAGDVAVEVRRRAGAAPQRPRVPPGRRPRRKGRLRHRRHRRRAGAGPRRGERAAASQGRRRREEAEADREEEGARRLRVLGRADLRAAGARRARSR